jgi:hypothetical protein
VVGIFGPVSCLEVNPRKFQCHPKKTQFKALLLRSYLFKIDSDDLNAITRAI